MNELKEYIISAQDNDSTAIMFIIDKFQPLIKNRCKIVDYDEDFESDLTLGLIEIINNINLDSFSNTINDAVLFKYISVSIKRLSYKLIEKIRIISNELIVGDVMDMNRYDYCSFYDSEVILLQTIKESLTPREYSCVKHIILDGYSAAEISVRLKISRQAVNQCKKGALDKLKNIII